jgi:hypothetical protein
VTLLVYETYENKGLLDKKPTVEEQAALKLANDSITTT